MAARCQAALSPSTRRQTRRPFAEKKGWPIGRLAFFRRLRYSARMRFLLYNVRYCTGNGGLLHLPWSGYLRRTQRRLKAITGFIASWKPDIVGLLEVDSGSYRSGRKNQAEVIADALGHYHVYASKYARPSLARALPILNKQVNAFLTRDAIHNERFHYFTRGVKRLAIELELENLTIFLVHLSLSFRTRHHQMSDLYTLVKKVKTPCIVAGDFNAFWGDREIHLFLAATGLTSACPEGRPSFPSWAPKRQLDFILHSPQIAVRHFYTPSVTYSDHLPLVCDFTIRK